MEGNNSASARFKITVALSHLLRHRRNGVKLAMVRQYENITNLDNKNILLTAQKILDHGWVRRGYPSVVLTSPIPWKLHSQTERSWNFYIHCLDMVDVLLKAYSSSNELRFLERSLAVALDWVQTHCSAGIETTEHSPFAWYDMAVGLRAYRLAYIIDAGTSCNLIGDTNEKALWQAIQAHVKFLADDKNVVFHNNHGLYQVAGQLAMGRRFASKDDLFLKSYKQGLARIRRMLETQFCPDGVHREHSPDYHRMVYQTLRGLIEAGLVCEVDIKAFAQKIEHALSWFVLPNGHLANFGDSDYRRLSLRANQAENKWLTSEMQYAASGGKTGKAPERFAMPFTEGGYFIVRKPSTKAPSDFSKASYLAQQLGFHSRTHKHCDDLSFIWSDRGSPLLVDAGRYGYIGKTEQGTELWQDGFWYSDHNRVYCESTRAHNTLEFDRSNLPRKRVRPYGSALRRWAEDPSGIVTVESEYTSLPGIRWARLLILNPEMWLIVIDWFNDNRNINHDVRQWFHLAPELELALEPSGYVAKTSDGCQPLRIASLLSEPIPSRRYFGEREPELQGWCSHSERQIVPNFAFCFEIYNRKNGAFATLFSFSDELSADTIFNRINLSGRQGRLRWADSSGNHEVRFSRPTAGKIELSYRV